MLWSFAISQSDHDYFGRIIADFIILRFLKYDQNRWSGFKTFFEYQDSTRAVCFCAHIKHTYNHNKIIQRNQEKITRSS